MTRRTALGLAVVLLLGSVPVLVSPGTMLAAASLAPRSSAALVYLWAPAVFASTCILLLSPGLLLALATGMAPSPGAWIASGLALTLLTLIPATALAQSIAGADVSGFRFAALVIACAALSLWLLLVRCGGSAPPRWPLSRRDGRWTVLSAALVPALLLALLAPKFHWENFNGDGHHQYESARLLSTQPVPSWSSSAGFYSSYPSTSSMLSLYPVSWFIRLVGETEVSARLPYLLALAALYAAIVALAGHGVRRPPEIAECSLIWLALAVYTIVVAYSATYSPYSADIGCPAARETLFMACYTGFLLGFVERNLRMLAAFAVLCVFCLPTGLLVIVLWLAAAGVTWRPRPRREAAWTLAVLMVCSAVSALLPAVLSASGLPKPGNELNAAEQIFRRFQYIQWSHWERFLYAAVPGGILPAIALCFWRVQDRVSRAITLTTISYFGFFYFQASIALHHFIPAMLLPLIVFWRVTAEVRHATLLKTAAAAAGLAALAISLPPTFRPDTSGRVIGSRIEDRLSGVQTHGQSVLGQVEVLHHLFPYDWDSGVPDRRYGGAPGVWYFYSRRSPAESRDLNYILQPAGAPAPSGAVLAGTEAGAAVYVRDVEAWRRDAALRPPTPAVNPLYAVPRWMMFGGKPPAGARGVVRTKTLVDRLSPKLAPALKRLLGKR